MDFKDFFISTSQLRNSKMHIFTDLYLIQTYDMTCIYRFIISTNQLRNSKIHIFTDVYFLQTLDMTCIYRQDLVLNREFQIYSNKIKGEFICSVNYSAVKLRYKILKSMNI